MEYPDQPLQFISKHYFHSKTEGDDNYDTISLIFRLLFGIKPTLFNAMVLLSSIYIIPKVTEILQKLSQRNIAEKEKFEDITEKENFLTDSEILQHSKLAIRKRRPYAR